MATDDLPDSLQFLDFASSKRDGQTIVGRQRPPSISAVRLLDGAATSRNEIASGAIPERARANQAKSEKRGIHLLLIKLIQLCEAFSSAWIALAPRLDADSPLLSGITSRVFEAGFGPGPLDLVKERVLGDDD